MVRRLALVATIVLVFPAAALAHAEISPAVSLSGKLQLYSLTVPTEKASGLTTKIELTLPNGFSIDSFVPASGWRRQLQQSRTGGNAAIQKVTWTGGRVPSGEDSLFQFLATPASNRIYAFTVRQTYADGSIVNWSGPASSDSPAPTIEAKRNLGGGGTSVLSILALIIGGLGLLAGAFALAGVGGGSDGEGRRALA